MLAGRYTLLEPRGADEVFAAAAGRGIIAVGVFNSGILANNRASANSTYNYEPAELGLISRANEIAEVCEQHGSTLPHAALAFPSNNPSVVSVAVGMRTSAQVARNVELLNAPPPQSLWDELYDSGLLAGAVRWSSRRASAVSKPVWATGVSTRVLAALARYSTGNTVVG